MLSFFSAARKLNPKCKILLKYNYLWMKKAMDIKTFIK